MFKISVLYSLSVGMKALFCPSSKLPSFRAGRFDVNDISIDQGCDVRICQPIKTGFNLKLSRNVYSDASKIINSATKTATTKILKGANDAST